MKLKEAQRKAFQILGPGGWVVRRLNPLAMQQGRQCEIGRMVQVEHVGPYKTRPRHQFEYLCSGKNWEEAFENLKKVDLDAPRI